MKEWKKIGQILAEEGILSPKTVARVLAVSKKHNKRFGWTLEKLELVTGEEMADAIAKQFGLKLASNLTRLAYTQELLDLVTCEVAVQNLIFPLKQAGGSLLLAMVDPTNMKIVNNLASNTGLKIVPCVATRNEIYAAICKHYLMEKVLEPEKDTVLVVEDESTTMASLRYFLSAANYNVVVAHDGMEGFRKIIAGKPHVILTDKVMPKFDGFALLRAVKAIPDIQSIPVILMSGKLTPAEEMKVFEMGFFDYIPKPINSTTLISRVKRAFSFSEQKYDFF